MTNGLALVVMPEGAAGRETVHRTVEELGYRVETYRDAGAALEAVEYGTPGLVVHAWELPDMDGATFHVAVRRRSGGRNVPTLAIVPPARAREAAAAGIRSEEIVDRPLREEDLRSRLGALLGIEPPAAAGDPNERKERATMEASTAPARPAQRGEPRRNEASASPADLAVRAIGLGEWGIKGAEILSGEGMDVRAIDTGSLDRSSVSADRRHRLAVPGRGVDDVAAAARALAGDPGVGDAIAEDADADLVVVTANLGVGSGALLATLLQRLANEAPDVGRLAIARVPGARSGPDERALALVALNAVLQAPQSAVLLVQPAEGPRGADDPQAAVRRLVDLLRLAARGEPVQPFRSGAIARALATPGFLGWREIELAREDCAADAGPWHDKLRASVARWQPTGFAWAEAQTVLAFARAPEAWLEGGARAQFERLVQGAWDEAAPCILETGLYAGEQPGRAILLSSGMPYPSDVLALRDGVQADRARLAEKRKAAETLIPLGEDFLPGGASLLFDAPVAAPRPRVVVETPAPVRAVELPPAPPAPPEPEPVVEPEPAFEPEPVFEREPEPVFEPEPEPAFEYERVFEAEETIEIAPVVDEPREVTIEAPAFEEPAVASEATLAEARGVEALDVPEVEPGAMPAPYETALALVRRILSAQDLRAEADLGEVRYALYDLLEILREEPEAILPEVFRPSREEWFERHHVNVAILTILTGDLLKGSLSEVIDLGTAAMLHDVGMVSGRDTWDVAMKLPPKVFERAVRPHPETGFRMLQDVPGMTAPIARMVLEEHERMDGTGYPEGLVGDAIDPGARILAVCDTLEALTHPRPHREAMKPGEALARLQVLGDYTLDSNVVGVLVDELGTLLRRAKGAADVG